MAAISAADVVAGLVDEMPAAEVHGLDALEIGRELARHMLDQLDRAVVQRLAQRVHVEDVDVLPRQLVEFALDRAEARVGRARVVERTAQRRVGVAGIDADADLDAGLALHDGQEAGDLLGRVEVDVVGDAGEAFDLGLRIGRRVDVHLLAELLAPHARLVLAARRGAVEHVAQHRKRGRHRPRLGGEQHLGAGLALDARGRGEVALQCCDVQHIGRRADVGGYVRDHGMSFPLSPSLRPCGAWFAMTSGSLVRGSNGPQRKRPPLTLSPDSRYVFTANRSP